MRLCVSTIQGEGKTPAKAGRKGIPSSFVEVIDTLVDFVLRHHPPGSSQAAAGDSGATGVWMYTSAQLCGPAGVSAGIHVSCVVSTSRAG